MHIPYLINRAFLFTVVLCLASCGSGSNSNPENASNIANSAGPESAEANEGQNSPTPFSIRFQRSEFEDTGYEFDLILSADLQSLSTRDSRIVAINLQGAIWDVDKQPDACEYATSDLQFGDRFIDTLVCDFNSTIAEQQIDSKAELTLSIELAPYENKEFSTELLYSDPVTTHVIALQYDFSYTPKGTTTLDPNSSLALEIKRVLQLGSGTIVKSIHEGFRSLDNCPDGGQIEEISPSDFFFGTSQDRYVNCAHGAVVFDGEISSGFGRDSLFTELVDATMIISEPQLIDFSGTVRFTTERGRPDTTTLTGQIEQIDSLGEVITFSSYSSYCESGAPAQPHRVFIPGSEPEPIESIQTVFVSNDNLLEGNRLTVSIEAKFDNQGKVTMQSDNGSRINMAMTGGTFPAVFIDLLGESQEEHWIIPWTDEYAFACQPW